MALDLSNKKSIFRKYDIRGVYPQEVSEEFVGEVARVLAEKFFKKGRVVVGRDGRYSSPALYAEAVRILNQSPGIEVIEAGILTTPCFFFIVNESGASGGMMITASHNPKDHNGIKVVGRGACDFGGEDIYALLK